MKFPDDIKYTKEHQWIKFEGEIGIVGITDFAQKELGDIVYVDIEQMDEQVEADKVYGTIEAVKTVSDLFMPISGEVIEFNEKLEDDPELVNTDPFGEGWIIKIKANNPNDVDALLSDYAYKELVNA